MKYFAALFLSLVLSAPAVVNAQAGNVSERDARFLQEAANSGLFEMQASQLAIQAAAQERIKEFARMMLVEHEKIDGDLKSLAMARKIELPIDLEGARQDTLDTLQQDKGAAFDKRYVEQVAVEAHKRAVTLFTEASEKSDDDEIKAFAGKALKTLQQHLQHAQNLAKAYLTDHTDRSGTTGGSAGGRDMVPVDRRPSEKGLPEGQATPQTAEPTREGASGTAEQAAESQ